MFRLLRWRLGRTLLRAAGRRCGGCTARLLPERTGDAGTAEQPGEDASDEAEAEIIQLLKQAKLSIMKDEPECGFYEYKFN